MLGMHSAEEIGKEEVGGRELGNSMGNKASEVSAKVSIEGEYIAEIAFLYEESSE